MGTIKAYTTIEQSRKLAEILSIESADQTWARITIAGANLNVPEEMQYRHNGDMPFQLYSGIGIPCWSLAALLNYLKSKNKFPEIEVLSNGCFKLTIYIWDGENSIQVSIRDTLVDACYEMILKLHESNLL